MSQMRKPHALGPQSTCRPTSTIAKKNPLSTITTLKDPSTGTTLRLATAGTGTNLHAHGATISENLRFLPALMLVIKMKDNHLYTALKPASKTKSATVLLMMNGSSLTTTTSSPSTIPSGLGELMRMSGTFGTSSTTCGSLDQTALINTRFHMTDMVHES